LKPDVNPPPTEVGSGSTAPAHLFPDCSEEEGARRHSYLVRMIKPNLISSHDWHVQPICQRSLKGIRLSGPSWIEAQAVTPGCPRTCCARQLFPCKGTHRRFCANLPKLSNFHLHVKPNLSFARVRTNSLLAVYPRLRISDWPRSGKLHLAVSHSAKFQTATRQTLPNR
jgi:hypothetical protein